MPSEKTGSKAGKGWHETAGIGDRSGVWGIQGATGELLALAGTVILLVGCPGFVMTL